jgi:hypothetical protein
LTEEFVRKVIRGVHPHAILRGAPGLGKSYAVQKALQTSGLEERRDYIIVKGTLQPTYFFALLYSYRRPGQIVVLDDCDDILINHKSLGFLKTATDPDNRQITYGSQHPVVIGGVPVVDFAFNGTVIVCSNLALTTGKPGRRTDHMRAITSRMPEWPMNWDTREQKFAQVFNMVVNHDYLGHSDRTRLNDIQKEEMLTYLLTHLDSVQNLDLRLPQKIAAEIVAGGDWRASCAPFLAV